jgi:hypothetical protein
MNLPVCITEAEMILGLIYEKRSMENPFSLRRQALDELAAKVSRRIDDISQGAQF